MKISARRKSNNVTRSHKTSQHRTKALDTYVAGALVMLVSLCAFPVFAQDRGAQNPVGQDLVADGEYIFNLAGCVGCHTDKKTKGPLLAGGRAFKTDFGTFFSPNITPDLDTGIGRWSFADFRSALRDGLRPDGAHYFPAFPYTSYTHMTDDDISALWAYLQAQPSVSQPNQAHQLKAPFGWRWLVGFWKILYFEKGPKPEWPRGRYIAEALSHCPECHTPRNWLGGQKTNMAYGGTKKNPEGLIIPNITPDLETGTGKWKTGDFDMLFSIGMLPDGDFVGGVMGESVSHSTSKMTLEDRKALITYLQSVAPVHNPVKPQKAEKSGTDAW